MALVIALSVLLLGRVCPAPTVIARDPLPRLADYGLVLGDNATGLWAEQHTGDGPDGGSDPAALGSWAATDIRYADRALDMHVRVEPPAWSLPVEAGPAVLFTTLSLMGGLGGDVGYQRVVSIGSVPLPACTAEPCVFETDVHVDLGKLPAVARTAHRTQGFEEPSAGIGFTLVRTFAGGTWLQKLEGYDRIEEEAPTGRTLQEPGTWQGRAEPTGLFPASTADGPRDEPGLRHFDYGAVVEQARRTVGDTTRPVTSTPVRFIAQSSCSGPLSVALDTAAGDQVVLDSTGSPPRVDATVELPVGTTWRVADIRHPVPFVVGSTDLLVVARYTCAGGYGVSVTDVTVAQVVSSVTSSPSASPVPSAGP